MNEIRARHTPQEPLWHWTDDTALALALQRSLDGRGLVDQDHLALCYALAFDADQARGYGHGMHLLLPQLLAAPADWRTLAPGLFDGGSLGNGAAMRFAPFGARFHEDLDRVAEQAVLSAAVTHAHPDGIAGAVAVAVAAALWATAEGFGDVDTTCAITGGVVGAATGTAGAPKEWLRRREPLG
ncbi:ADP-ribosylglycohydrolase [Streptomyces sp. ScaeMP-e83]|nr:ADP-ribosylglycohydrolase [Streptomyces sp. ScaeMP-e83]